MYRMVSLAKRVALGAFAAALFVVAAGAQAPTASPLPQPVLGPPNASNHFIETPKGWVHPKTAWGEPDLQGTWPIPGGINLERGPNSCPANPPGRGRGAAPAPGTPPPPACDPTSPWLSDEEWKVVSDRYELLQKVGDASTQALAKGDFVILITPLTERTRGLFDAKMLAHVKRGAYFINVARGNIVDEKALREAIVAGRLSGATFDVFHQEPLPADDPMWDAPEVIVTPHVSGEVADWQALAAGIFMDNLERWMRGEPLANVCDPDLGY